MEYPFPNNRILVREKRHKRESIPRVLDLGSPSVSLCHEIVERGKMPRELLHWHEGFELIRAGRHGVGCRVNLTDVLLQQDEICFINCGRLHHIFPVGSQSCDADVLHVELSCFPEGSPIAERYIGPLASAEGFSHLKLDSNNRNAKSISDLMDLLYESAEEKPTGFEMDVTAYVHMVLRRVYLSFLENGEGRSADEGGASVFRQMASFIRARYAERVTLDDIASAAGCSPSKCLAIFKSYAQMTPVAFLNEYRLEKSAACLADSGMTVADIARACGFGEPSYYNRVFLRAYGCTPLTWRRMKGSGSKQ